MGFSVTGLTNYVDQTSERLIGQLIFEGRSRRHMTLQPGVKNTTALQLLNVTAYPQAGGCSPTASGQVAFAQRNITVGDTTYFDGLCMKDLKAKWTQHLLLAGSYGETTQITFEQAVANELISRIQSYNETCIWQGDTTSGDPTLSKWDGLIKIIDAAGTATAGNTGNASAISATATNATQVRTIVNAMCDARPAALKTAQNQKLFVGTDTFDKWVTSSINAGNYHIDQTGQTDAYVVRIPGKNVEMVGVHGLDGTNRMFLGAMDNFYLGTDLANEEEVFRMFYREFDQKVYYHVQFKLGTQVARPDELVQFTLA